MELITAYMFNIKERERECKQYMQKKSIIF
jgi:hypothetical protein